MEIIVREIETEGSKYGMKRNRDKCEALQGDDIDNIRFLSGDIIKAKQEVKYLGCMLKSKSKYKQGTKYENVGSICSMEKTGSLLETQ